MRVRLTRVRSHAWGHRVTCTLLPQIAFGPPWNCPVRARLLLARDIGRRVGCGAHLVDLRRTRVGRFTQPLTPASLEQAFGDGSWREMLLPLDVALAGYEAAVFGAVSAAAIRQGKVLRTPGITSSAVQCVAYSPEGTAIAVLRRVDDDSWHPGPVFEGSLGERS